MMLPNYQAYGTDATGRLTHCGPVFAPRASLKAGRRIQRKWQVWRAGYLLANPGNYPLRDVAPTRFLGMRRIGATAAVQWFIVDNSFAIPRV